MPRRRRLGFSLLEMLIVLAILGIMAGVGYASMRKMLARSQLDSAAAQVASDLRRARSFAQTKNFAAKWEKTSDTGYKLDLNGTVKTYTLPPGTKFVGVADGTTIEYRPPYGEVKVNGSAIAAIKLTIANDNGMQTEVRVVGVTGKVIRQ